MFRAESFAPKLDRELADAEGVAIKANWKVVQELRENRKACSKLYNWI